MFGMQIYVSNMQIFRNARVIVINDIEISAFLFE